MIMRQTCPVCDTEFDFDLTPVPRAPGLAAALGIGVEALALQHGFEQAQRRERLLHDHLAGHTPEEWLPKLMEARRYAEAADDELEREGGTVHGPDGDFLRRPW